MGTIQRVTTLLLVVLTVAAAAARAQEPKTTAPNAAFDDAMSKADALVQQRKYEEALQSYKKAFALTDKSSYEACIGIALAYRGLGAHKNVADVCADALKLAGDARQQAAIHNMRGAALVALADKPGDKRLQDAEREFLAAIGANEELYPAHLNLGVTLLKMNRDEEGIKVLKHYVEVAPRGKEVDNALRMIEEPRRAREAYAPDFSFTSKDGEFITLEDLKGKTVVLDFWGTWCKPCLMATPDLLKLRKKYAEQPVVFVGVASRDQEPEWAAYIEKNKMDWPQFLDTNRKIITPFAVVAYPTYIIIDGEGVVRARKSGYSPSDTQAWLDDEIKRTLKKRGPS
ncbi:MAG TPA: redoxin domain-containing protein [Vicinamibacterales bacterium]|nr:redoxin domain-containing protein [Vicinamibacterales bacterium]